MEALEPKKLALIRILQILKKYSDSLHLMTQEDIAQHLERDYGIIIERKAISRNLSLLKEAGYEIVSERAGSYIEDREFEDSELRMLIDGVLSSRYITAKHSKDLIEKLCNMSNVYFRSHIKNIFSVNDWGKTDNQAVFFNIELVDEAIERAKQVKFVYNKYGTDKKLHPTKTHTASPYQLILHNQHYYLMSYNEHWHNMAYYRLDRITNMTVTENPLTPITTLAGYESGINYKELASCRPYMYTDKLENIEFTADKSITDQIIDWFGKDINISETGDEKITVRLKASPNAMEYWAMQYINFVEITKPAELRERIKSNLKKATEKYL